MSRYYCKNCGTVVIEGDDTRRSDDLIVYCPFCENYKDGSLVEMQQIPNYETPDQYEKRTGKKWNGATFVKCKSDYCSRDKCFYYDNSKWYIMQSCIQFPITCLDFLLHVCAHSPEPPRDGWKPEE